MFTCPFGPALPGGLIADCATQCLCGPHNTRELQGAAILRDVRTALDKILKYGLTEDRVHEARLAINTADRWWHEFHERADVQP